MPDDEYEPVCKGYNEIIAKQNARITELEAKLGCYAMTHEVDWNIVKLAEKRIATLEALIADAPHHQDCPRSSKHSSFLSCNCFKSRALDTKEKSDD